MYEDFGEILYEVSKNLTERFTKWTTYLEITY